MNTTIDIAELPFPLVPSDSEAWRHDPERGAISAEALPHSDFYINPAGAGSADAESLHNAITLLGTPPSGDYQLSCRVEVAFASLFDAGVLMLWLDGQNWAKFCFEFSPASQPMVVSVVTRGVSDDANAFPVTDRTIWLRVSRVDGVYAYHASTDAQSWELIRVFSLGQDLAAHQIGFEAQSPTGNGCRVTFDEIRFTSERLADLRDGS